MGLTGPESRTISSAILIAVVALVVGMAGGATAAALITGEQIKDNTVSTKDIKDKSLLLKDFKPSERAKLKGATGEAGSSAFGPPPSGMTFVGGHRVRVESTGAGRELTDYVDLPFTTAEPLQATYAPGTERNLFFAPDDDVFDEDENATACPGDTMNPTATPGNLCIYIDDPDWVADGSMRASGGFYFQPDPADRTGFTIWFTSEAAAVVNFNYSYAYQAP